MNSLRRRGYVPTDTDPHKLRITRTISNAATDQSVSERKLSISFGSISVHEYARIPGDNPSVSKGPPISVEWEHHDEYVIHIDDHERNKVHRSSSDLKMSPETRIEILKQNGHGMVNIQKSTNAANTDRKRRRRTARNIKIIQILIGAMNVFKCNFGKPFHP